MLALHLRIQKRIMVGAIALLLAWPTSAQILLSEIRVDQPGADADEYFELTGSAGQTLAGYTYAVLGDGTGGSGVLEAVIDLGTLQIPPDGVALVAEAGFSLGPTPDLVSNLNFENADNVTHLLLKGFTGTPGSDLDPDDDGVLDISPWAEVVDCLALLESVDSGDLVYCVQTVGPDGGSAPAHVYRDGDWHIGPADPSAGVDTPGSAPVGLAIEAPHLDAILRGSDIILSWTWGGGRDVEAFVVRDGDHVIAQVSVDTDEKSTGGPGKRYRVSVSNVTPGTHTLDLVTIARDGGQSVVASSTVVVPALEPVLLHGPYPNPTRGAARFSVTSGTEQTIDIGLFDSIGRRIQRYDSDMVESGETKEYLVDVSWMAAGLYFIEVRGRQQTVTKPLLVRR